VYWWWSRDVPGIDADRSAAHGDSDGDGDRDDHSLSELDDGVP
jgi:hypothetical protein